MPQSNVFRFFMFFCQNYEHHFVCGLFWVSFSKWKEGSASGKTRRELKGIKVMAQKDIWPNLP